MGCVIYNSAIKKAMSLTGKRMETVKGTSLKASTLSRILIGAAILALAIGVIYLSRGAIAHVATEIMHGYVAGAKAQ